MAISPSGRITTTLEWYNNEPSSIERAEKVKKVPVEQWKEFLENAVTYAKKSFNV
jgi:hypothetical protein